MASHFQWKLRLALMATLAVAVACTAFPFSLLASGENQTPATLALCEADPAQLCVVGFDAQPPDQMAIVLYMPPASLRAVYVITRHLGTSTRLACALATDLTSTFFCVGARVPLGSAIGIDVYARERGVLLAHGDFVVSAYALATLANTTAFTFAPTEAGQPSPIGTLMTPLTPLTPTTTPPTPGTAYPNPNP